MEYSNDEAKDSSADPKAEESKLADQVMDRCIRLVANCNRFKQERLNRIQLYRELKRLKWTGRGMLPGAKVVTSELPHRRHGGPNDCPSCPERCG